MELYCGMDLHSNNVYTGLLSADQERVLSKRLPCDLPVILNTLEPYRDEIKGIAVESTYNWYWLVDGLRAHNYNTVLANPAQMGQYNGLKHSDDKTDSFWIAEMLRLGILPTGHVYAPEMRPLRDLLRRRLWCVHQRTRCMLSYMSLYTRHTGMKLNAKGFWKHQTEKADRCFEHPYTQLQARVLHENACRFNEQAGELEAVGLKELRPFRLLGHLKSIPGVGDILAMSILMETGPISRFGSAGRYASYSRCVDSRRTSNMKKKGSGNAKNGNKYLAWAWTEASNFHRRFHEPAAKYHQRKTSKSCSVVATKSLAAKLAKAGYYIMRDEKNFESKRMFGS